MILKEIILLRNKKKVYVIENMCASDAEQQIKFVNLRINVNYSEPWP